MSTYGAELGLGIGQGTTSGETIRISAYPHMRMSCLVLSWGLPCLVLSSCPVYRYLIVI